MERESCQKRVDGLEQEVKGAKETFEVKQKNILERMTKEREGWGKGEG